MKQDLCPWLGTDRDRETRHAEPNEAHLCYAQERPAEIELDYQLENCLTARHRGCVFYRQPEAPAPPPTPEVPQEVEDEVGPAPSRFSLLRAILWIVAGLAAVAVIYYYGSTLLAPLPTPTPFLVARPPSSAIVTSLPTPGPEKTPVPAAPTFEFIDPTASPTPYPGGRIYALSPEAGGAGWVGSDESRGNHLGDSYLYSGVFDGIIYHGIFQIDLSAVPRGATIYAGVLEITGLDARRLGGSGVWEVRVLGREADEEWSRKTYQAIHNAPVQWSLPPALAVGDLVVGETNVFELSPEQLRDLEQRLLAEHYTVSFRIDGPLAGENSVFAWDTGYGPATQGHRPRLLLNVGPAPKTPIPTGSPPPTSTPTPSTTPTPSVTPTPTDTPIWVVVSSTPTPENVVTAAAIVARETVWAQTTGTATATPEFMATPTPRYIVVTNTPRPGNRATAIYERALATANAILTGTPTPTPHHLATATSTPRPTRTPVYIWLDEIEGTPTLTPSPTPTEPPIPASLRGKILFLSDRGGQPQVYMLDPATLRVALVTARWPYEQALAQESVSPDGKARAFVSNDVRGVPQVFIHSDYYGGDWQVTFNTGMSYNPVWSPHGDRLAFVSTEPGNDEIYSIGIDGTDQRRLTFNHWEWDKHPTWSPDGSQIVFWSNEGSGRQQLWIMNADGSERCLLLESLYNDWDPVWIK